VANERADPSVNRPGDFPPQAETVLTAVRLSTRRRQVVAQSCLGAVCAAHGTPARGRDAQTSMAPRALCLRGTAQGVAAGVRSIFLSSL